MRGKSFLETNFKIVPGVPTHHRERQCSNASLPVAHLSGACRQVIHDLPPQVENTLCQTGNGTKSTPILQLWEPVQRQVPQLWKPSPGQPTTYLERIQDTGGIPSRLQTLKSSQPRSKYLPKLLAISAI